MRSPNSPEHIPPGRQLDDATARIILGMIVERRERLTAEWASLERGSRESGENLAADGALMDLKWAIEDVLLRQVCSPPTT